MISLGSSTSADVNTRPVQKSAIPLFLIVRAYVFSLPFSYAMSLRNGSVTSTLIIGGVLGLCLLAPGWSIEKRTVRNVAALFWPYGILLGSIFLGAEINTHTTDKSLPHFLAYASSVLCFAIIPYLAFSQLDDQQKRRVLLDIANVARFSCAAVLVQFVCGNFFNIFFEDFISYPESYASQSIFLGIFFRSRGFASEPGHFAFFLESIIPLLFLVNRKLKASARIYTFDILLTAFAFLSMGSPAGIAIMILGLSFATILTGKVRFQAILRGGIALILILGSLSVILDKFTESNLNAWDAISGIFVDKTDSSSSMEREDRFRKGIDLFINASPIEQAIGYGPAVYMSQNLGDDTIIQLYLLLILEAGAIGLFSFLLALLILAANIKKLPPDYRHYMLWALINCALHYVLISNYYYPYIWLLYPALMLFTTSNPALSNNSVSEARTEFH